VRARILVRLATREVRSAIRARWFFVGAASLALLAAAVAHLGMGDAARWGVSAIDRTSAALLDLVLLFVPLLALPVGAASFAGEREDGTLAYLVAQPVTRGEVFLGKLLGLVLAMTLSIALGFGGAAAFVGVRGGISVVTFGALAVGAWILAVLMVVVGALLSLAARTRARATTGAIATWITLVFLCDFGVLALAATQALGPQALFVLSIVNPLQAIKTSIALFVSARLEVLGPVGVHAVRVFGRAWLETILFGSVAAWTLLCAATGHLLLRRSALT
jgi:ABC-type transport system involved in multi-copper enzyme maturation permease subunit